MNWNWQRIKYGILGWIQRVMYGRNGWDSLAWALLLAGLVLSITARFTRNSIFLILYYLCMVLCVLRVFSKNIDKRQQENMRFLTMRSTVVSRFRLVENMFRERRTHRYLRCEACGQFLRVPKGKGKIEVRCRQCGHRFIKNV